MQSPHGEAPRGNTTRDLQLKHCRAGVRRGTTDWTQGRTTARMHRLTRWALVSNNAEAIKNRKKKKNISVLEMRSKGREVKFVRS